MTSADISGLLNVANKSGVRSIPNFMVFSESGKHHYTGPTTSGALLAFVSELLGDGITKADESSVFDSDFDLFEFKNMMFHQTLLNILTIFLSMGVDSIFGSAMTMEDKRLFRK
jgi:hypothetical protein